MSRIALPVWISLLVACTPALRTPTPPRLDPADVTVDGLQRVKDARLAMVYLRPGADLSSYDKVELGPISVSYKSPPRANRYARGRENFPLTPTEIEKVKSEFRRAFIDELARGAYEVVTRKGPDVLSLQAEIVDLVVRQPPATAGTSWVFIQSAGELTLVAELHDSMTGATLARIADRRAVQSPAAAAGGLYYSSPVGNWNDLRVVFKRWARQLREALDEAHALEAARQPVTEGPETGMK